MIKWIETTGRSEEDAISAALFQLGLDRDDVSVEVIERAKSGFLGFGSNPAKVRVSYEVEDEGGSPKATQDILEVLSATKPEPKAEPKQEAKPAPQPQPKVEAPKVETPQAEEAPAQSQPAPRAEETILAAKPGWSAPKKSQSRPERGERRDHRGSKKPRPSQLREEDEVLIGTPDRAPRKVETLTPASAEDERAQKISQFLTGLMEHLHVVATPEVYLTEEGNYKVILQGSELGAIIGRRGETLDAIQQLTSYAVNHGQSKRVRVHIDAEGYRAKREESLQRLAVKVATKVIKYRKSMTLEPMNAYERHVIHTALQDYPHVTTFSTGVEPNRRTVVAYDPDKK
jgi:spoIIIJ-associated protein